MHRNRGRSTVVQLDAYRTCTDGPPTAAQPSGEFICFRLGDDEYGIDIHSVHEVRPYREPTQPAAGVPPFVTGVIGVDGTSVSVVDLRLVFALERRACDAHTAVIIVKLPHGRVAVVVDAVRDVLALAAHQIRPPPQAYGSEDTGLIHGIGRPPGRSLLLMDIGALMRNLRMDGVEHGWH